MMNIELKTEVKKQSIASLQRYFEMNMEESISHLQASILLDYFLKEIGPCIYNQAVSDVQNHMQTRIQELDIDVHAEEFTYWSHGSVSNKRR